jgi:O-antigen/teichoic acid export membrane protein
MLNLNYEKEFSRIIFIGACIGIIMALLLIPKYAAIGVSVSVIIVESAITLMLGLFVLIKIKRKYESSYFGWRFWNSIK